MGRWLIVGIAGLLVCAAVLVVSMKESEAQVAVTDGEVILLTVSDGSRDKIVVYHKPSCSFIVYGHTGDGIELVQIRRLANDFELAPLMRDVPYTSKGYSAERVAKELAKQKEKQPSKEPEQPL